VAGFPSLPEGTERVLSSVAVNNVIDILMVIVLLLYMASGSALSFSYSNLCYKTIQTKGPYGIIRHPAITFKIIWFSLAFYRFAPAFSFPWLLCYLFWMGIYVYRAFVEEEYLREFPEYRAYMQQTRYRFIPGIV
jgi:protein-S-isoprenylcysteine O-methyltransferase Ste14